MSSPPSAARSVVVVLTVLAALVGVTWAVLTPAFRAPDEPQHLNSVLRLAHGGGWPDPGTATMSVAVARAQEEAAQLTDLPGRFRDRGGVDPFTSAEPPPADQRSSVTAATALTAASPRAVDQMTQHPPAYYAVAAGVLHATGLTEGRWDVVLLVLRLLSVAMVVPVVPLAALAAWRITAMPAAAVGAGAVPLALPQLWHVGSSVTNDALAVLAGSLCVVLSARVLTGDLRRRTALALGLAVGLALLTKFYGVLLLPVVALAFALAPGGSRRRRVGSAATALGTALVVGGWWWVRNVVVLGAVQPGGMAVPGVPSDDSTLAYVARAVRRLARSFVGNLAWLEVPMPAHVVLLVLTGLLGFAAVALVSARPRRPMVVLAALPALLALAVLWNATYRHLTVGTIGGVQGRYLFSAVAALAVVAGTGAALTAGAGRERRPSLARRGVVPAVVGASIVTALYGVWFGFGAMYRAAGETVPDAFARWAGWSPLSSGQLLVLGGLLLAAVLGVAVALGSYARRTVRP
jgi:hypothetical protein